MNGMKIYEATCNGPVVCLPGENRLYAIGDTAYLFQRPLGTLTTFARGIPVMYVDGKWKQTQLARPIIKEWHDKVTVMGNDALS